MVYFFLYLDYFQIVIKFAKLLSRYTSMYMAYFGIHIFNIMLLGSWRCIISIAVEYHRLEVL